LLAEAGYDPRAAPEAWRLLSVKDQPADPSTLKYPSRSGYLLTILNHAYQTPTASAGEAGPTKR
jgi:hypothetical protein